MSHHGRYGADEDVRNRIFAEILAEADADGWTVSIERANRMARDAWMAVERFVQARERAGIAVRPYQHEAETQRAKRVVVDAYLDEEQAK